MCTESFLVLWRTVGIILFIGAVAFMLIYANTGNRFKNKW